ncbi:hypothetical protein NEUTE2DRAFT_127862 [Neurospora tetrasperma FGSC 2509]|nr:hypothetical protein NEUTE2DRAFT_127862 [Neurospora tetrasperma FGSC 2509]
MTKPEMFVWYLLLVVSEIRSAYEDPRTLTALLPLPQPSPPAFCSPYTLLEGIANPISPTMDVDVESNLRLLSTRHSRLEGG